MEKYTTQELKAMGFDEIQKLNITQNNIQIINAELEKRAKEVVEEKPKKK